MKKKKGRFLIRAGVLMIVAAALWGGYNLYDGFRAGQTAQESVGFLESVIASVKKYDTPDVQYNVRQAGSNGEAESAPSAGLAPSGNAFFEIPAADDTRKTVSQQENASQNAALLPDDPIAVDVPREVEIPDYVLNPNMEMPVSRYNGQDYIGILEIPALELKIPVISEWNYPRLRISPCRYTGSAYTNNLVISAHNYAAHFGNIHQLYEGAAVRFTDVDGNVFNYRVGLKETLNPRDVEYMKDSGWDLTLFTCTPGGSYRVTVRCDLVNR